MFFWVADVATWLGATIIHVLPRFNSMRLIINDFDVCRPTTLGDFMLLRQKHAI